MKVQIIYANFIPRILATCLDLTFIALTFSPVAKFCGPMLFVMMFQGYLVSRGVDVSNKAAIFAEIGRDFITNVGSGKIILFYAIFISLQLLVVFLYFIILWSAYGTTPGAYLMRFRVCDANSYTNISARRAVVRAVYGISWPIGVWSILVTAKKQALHDKLSGTVVIKV